MENQEVEDQPDVRANMSPEEEYKDEQFNDAVPDEGQNVL